VEPAPVREFGRTRVSGQRLLLVRLSIENTSAAKKVDYRGWGSGLLTGPVAHDDHENHYRSIDFGIGAHPIGQVIEESIHPGGKVEDLLVFEPPIAQAEYLTLALPGDNVDEPGTIRFLLPRLMWDHTQEEARLRAEAARARAERDAKEAAERARQEAAARDAERRRREQEEAAAEAKRKAEEQEAQRRKIAASIREAEREEQRRLEAEASKQAEAEGRARANLNYAKKLLDQRKTDDAQERLRKIIKEYPDTKAAKEAKKLLEDTGGRP
jgi:flagellar biosynthesis GTPase FlhF